MSDEKSAVRRDLRARLRALSPCERTAASARITNCLAQWPGPAAGHLLAGYLPLPSEPDPTGWYDLWRAAGGRLACPLIVGPDRLEFRQLPLGPPGTPVAATGLRPGPHGLREPDPSLCPLVAPAEITLVLVPGLGFARGGARLGRGGGYYDRWLATLPPDTPTIGVAFAVQIVPGLPCEPHDRRVDHLVTDTGWLPGARGLPPASA